MIAGDPDHIGPFHVRSFVYAGSQRARVVYAYWFDPSAECDLERSIIGTGFRK
jgi:hypothetical protein